MKIVHDEIQIEENDLMDLDAALGEVIYKGLKAFREKANKSTFVMIPTKVMHNVCPNKSAPYTDEEEAKGKKEWLDILEAMENAFIDCGHPEIVYTEEEREARLQGRLLFARYFDNLWS
ncbi:hypothetical protein ECO340P2_00042 [Escherichia phage ECO340P2]|nr:hypothetical protein ECO340P2_00042 [Escherichia phage ECO340P2]